MTTNTNNINKAIDFISSYFANPQAKLCADTRKLKAGDVFIAYNIDDENPSNKVCNFSHIEQAISLGISAIIADSSLELDENYAKYQQIPLTIPILTLPLLHTYMGDIVSHFNDYPSSKLPVIGITGTNGKTSISTWLAQCINALNQSNNASCVIGTLGTGFLDNLHNTGFTTPDAINLHYQLNEYAVKAGAKTVCMEVSSHGLKQSRVAGVKFHSAIFTNLTQDHLDYHGTLEDYIDAKHLLFKKHNLAYAVINVDDEVGRKFIQTTKQNAGTASICYTMHEQNICSDNYVYIKNYEFISGKNNGYNLNLAIKFNQQIIQDNLYISILGEFNLYNLMAVIGGLLSLGYTWQDIKNVLPVIKSVAGRLEIVNNSKNGSNSSKLVLVDYAHTPDALEKTLTTLKPIAIQRNGKLWCVFGCGGNRDRTKRPIMGSISQNNADISIITSDNPRFEEPAEIIKDILIGINTHSIINETVKIIEDRYDAINYAIEHMQEQDVLLIAGKGHETYQDIKGVKHDFSDVLVAEGVL